DAEAKQRADADAKRKAEADAKKKAEAAAAEKVATEKAAAEKAAAEAKKQAAADAKKKADAEAKKKADADAKKKADAAKAAAAKEAANSEAALNDVLNGLTQDASGGGSAAAGGQAAGSGKAGAPGPDGDKYGGLIKQAVSRNMYDTSLYRGKTCSVKINFAPDGLILSSSVVGGDPALCQAAERAIKITQKLPQPPSDAVYNKFKNAVLEFKF
ncbi:MAG: cell envelope integrity protein TolA, partial [Plesiomonas sp.]